MGKLQVGDPADLGRYRLHGRLGEGGQGVVYLGRGRAGNEVAVKLLRALPAGDRALRERFEREIAVAEKIAGFCTARVLEAGIVGDRPYIISEYVPGPSLQELVKSEGPRAGTELDRLAIGTATALTAIHRAGVVHRDFKPANVLIGPDGPRVIDFGIARALEAGAEATTASGMLGTPGYMAPEQIAGHRVGTPVDVFAWAVTMVYAATGSAPFAADGVPAVLNRILHTEPDLTGVPEPLDGLLRQCLTKDPAGRPTARQVLLSLLGEEATAEVLDEVHLTAGAVSRRPTGRRKPLVAIAAVAGGLLVLSATGLVAFRVLGSGSADSVGVPAADAPALSAATRALPSALSYDYRQLGADRTKLAAESTSAEMHDYDALITDRSSSIITSQAVVQTSVADAGLAAGKGDHATVLADVTTTSTSASWQGPRTADEWARAEMVKQNGRWLLNHVDGNVTAVSSAANDWPGRRAAAVLDAARRCVHAMNAIDYRTLARTLSQVRTCGTGVFRSEWIANSGRLRAVIVNNRTVTNVTAIGTATCTGGGQRELTVLAFVNRTVTSSSSAAVTQRLPGELLTMRLVGRTWKVAKIVATSA